MVVSFPRLIWQASLGNVKPGAGTSGRPADGQVSSMTREHRRLSAEPFAPASVDQFTPPDAFL
jgi:hypothetical protein